eukprot:UN06082
MVKKQATAMSEASEAVQAIQDLTPAPSEDRSTTSVDSQNNGGAAKNPIEVERERGITDELIPPPTTKASTTEDNEEIDAACAPVLYSPEVKQT